MICASGAPSSTRSPEQLNKEWDQNALDTASSPESLSMAADDYGDSSRTTGAPSG